MPALTKDRNTQMKDAELIAVPVAAGAVIYGGAMVVANATGFAAPASTALNLTYLGRAEESVNNAAGANGAKTALVRRKQAFFFANLAADALTQADLGKTVYMVDDQTVAKTNGGGTRSAGGKLVEFTADGVWVE